MPPPDQFMLDKLKDSGLVPSDIDATLESVFGQVTESFRIPYYTPDGKTHPAMYRIRLAHPVPGQGKYTQPSTEELVRAGFPPDVATYPYLNPKILGGVTWETIGKTNGKTLLIVEGELKAASAGKLLGLAAIGIPGCEGAVRRNERHIAHVNPTLRGLIQSHDKIEVCLDGDIFSNPNVNRAGGTLKRAMGRLGVPVVFVILPAPPPGCGAGIDDWLMRIPPADHKHAFAALPRVSGEDFAEDIPSAADYFGLNVSPKTGYPLPTALNMQRLMEKHPRYKERYYFDQMRGNMYRNDPTGPVPFVDSFGTDEQVWLQHKFGMHISKSMALDSIRWMADQKRWQRNLLLESLPPWDGVPRMERMFIDGWGADDNDYVKAVGKNWLVSALARATTPGCKVDTMLVLVGPQGIFKSLSLEALGGGFYVPTHAQADNKDFVLAIHRGWIIDLAELSSMNHADHNHIKAVITTSTDFIRPPYGAATVEMPRHSILVGTTNEERFLRDQTGNRRYWPIGCGTISMAWITKHRDQLLAEARAALSVVGRTWWDMPQAATLAAQEERTEEGAWDEPLRRYLAANENSMRIITVAGVQYRYVTTDELLSDGLLIEDRNRKEWMKRDVGYSMKRIAKTSKWEKYQYSGSITLKHGGTAELTRGYRSPVTGNPKAKVIDLPVKQNPF